MAVVLADASKLYITAILASCRGHAQFYIDVVGVVSINQWWIKDDIPSYFCSLRRTCRHITRLFHNRKRTSKTNRH